MQPPFDGPFGGPRGFGRHGRHFGPFGGHFGGQQGTPPSPEQQALWNELRAVRHQLAATLSVAQNDANTLNQVKAILTQARTALAALASQAGTASTATPPQGDTTTQV